MESVKYPNSSNHTDIRWVGIDLADNGFVVNWDEREKKEEGCMDHCDSVSHSKVFGQEEKDAAFDHFIMLKKKEMGID